MAREPYRVKCKNAGIFFCQKLKYSSRKRFNVSEQFVRCYNYLNDLTKRLFQLSGYVLRAQSVFYGCTSIYIRVSSTRVSWVPTFNHCSRNSLVCFY